eukprot:scaffold5238_cov177-Amphora_coffeaeformis.AAC.2
MDMTATEAAATAAPTAAVAKTEKKSSKKKRKDVERTTQQEGQAAMLGNSQERRARRMKILAVKRTYKGSRRFLSTKAVAALVEAINATCVVTSSAADLSPPPEEVPVTAAAANAKEAPSLAADSTAPAATESKKRSSSTILPVTTTKSSKKKRSEPPPQLPPPPPLPVTVLTSEPTWIGLPRRKPAFTTMARPDNTKAATTTTTTTPQQHQQVDTVFETMFGYTWGTQLTAVNETNQQDDSSMINIQVGAESTMTQQQQEVLHRILGPTRAARTLRLPSTQQGKFHRNNNMQARQSVQMILTGTRIVKPKFIKLKTSLPTTMRNPSPRMSSSATSASLSTVPTTQPTPTTTNFQKPSPPAPVGAAAAPPTGVDDLLQKMNDTGKVSTIAKTAVDWEHFKTDTGLAASLEEHTESKGAFLKKKDFLERVDHRKFEHERQVRERERVKKK